MKNTVETIGRGEINFWYPFLIVIVSIVMWGIRLEGKVNANEILSKDSEVILSEVRDAVIRMEKDVEFIRKDIEGR